MVERLPSSEVRGQPRAPWPTRLAQRPLHPHLHPPPRFPSHVALVLTIVEQQVFGLGNGLDEYSY